MDIDSGMINTGLGRMGGSEGLDDEKFLNGYSVCYSDDGYPKNPDLTAMHNLHMEHNCTCTLYIYIYIF